MTKKQLKIGFVLDDGLDKPDGVQQNILTLGGWLQDQGHSVAYLVGETRRRDIPNVYSLTKNIKVRFNGNRLSVPLSASRRKLGSILVKENFDVLHVQMPYHPLFAGRVVAIADKHTTVLGTFHILEFNWLVKILSRILGFYLRNNLKKFDHFFSVSEPARIFAEQSFKIESTILPNPVELARFKPSKKVQRTKSPVRIVFLGRLVARKGCKQLLKAIKILNDDHDIRRKVVVDICGDGPLRQQLEAYVRSNELSESVTFHGHVTEEKKIEVLRRADVAVYPSYGGESFGIVLIEAMAAEAGIVLAGNNPGYSSVLATIPEALFDPHDTNQLAGKLRHYINNPDSRLLIHQRQQKLVKNFDVNVIGKRLVREYRACINRKKG